MEDCTYIIGSDPQGCIVSNGSDVLIIRYNNTNNQNYYISNLTFYGQINYQGNSSNSGLINFENCRFNSMFYAAQNYNQLQISNCIFSSDNDGFYAYYNDGTINIINSLFYDNGGYALRVQYGAASVNIINCIMTNNYCTFQNNGSSILSLYSLYYNNGCNEPSSDTGVIYVDPLFGDLENGDFTHSQILHVLIRVSPPLIIMI